MVFPDSYTKSETDNSLANEVSATGNVSLNGNLGVGVGAIVQSVFSALNANSVDLQLAADSCLIQIPLSNFGLLLGTETGR